MANCGNLVTSLGHNLEDADSCGLDALMGDLISVDPMLSAMAANGGPTPTLALGTGSPAIDAAGSPVCPATDQRGSSRPRDGDGIGAAVCDIGAFEAPDQPIFADGFESGVLSGWSGSID